jgi:hypothetical protein
LADSRYHIYAPDDGGGGISGNEREKVEDRKWEQSPEKPPSATPYPPCQGGIQIHHMLVPPLAREVPKAEGSVSDDLREGAEAARITSLSPAIYILSRYMP